MTHQHAHRRRGAANRRRLALAMCLAAGYMVAEIVGGLLTNSLALLADAAHMASDAAALGLSLFAVWMAERPPTPRRTWGYYRVEIMAALVNGAALIAVSLFIFAEAYRRLLEPREVWGAAMLGVAAGGLAVNAAAMWVLRGGRTESLNVRGAWLHVLTDALGSVGAIAAAALIWAFGAYWADPAISALIGCLVIYSAWRLVAESGAVLLEFAPRGVDVDDVHRAIVATPGVLGCHDLHVWTITSGLDSLSAHVVVAEGHGPAEVLKSLRRELDRGFGIHHVTVQIEPEDFGRCDPVV